MKISCVSLRLLLFAFSVTTTHAENYTLQVLFWDGVARGLVRLMNARSDEIWQISAVWQCQVGSQLTARMGVALSPDVDAARRATSTIQKNRSLYAHALIGPLLAHPDHSGTVILKPPAWMTQESTECVSVHIRACRACSRCPPLEHDLAHDGFVTTGIDASSIHSTCAMDDDVCSNPLKMPMSVTQVGTRVSRFDLECIAGSMLGWWIRGSDSGQPNWVPTTCQVPPLHTLVQNDTAPAHVLQGVAPYSRASGDRGGLLFIGDSQVQPIAVAVALLLGHLPASLRLHHAGCGFRAFDALTRGRTRVAMRWNGAHDCRGNNYGLPLSHEWYTHLLTTAKEMKPVTIVFGVPVMHILGYCRATRNCVQADIRSAIHAYVRFVLTDLSTASTGANVLLLAGGVVSSPKREMALRLCNVDLLRLHTITLAMFELERVVAEINHTNSTLRSPQFTALDLAHFQLASATTYHEDAKCSKEENHPSCAMTKAPTELSRILGVRSGVSEKSNTDAVRAELMRRAQEGRVLLKSDRAYFAVLVRLVFAALDQFERQG